MQCCAWVGSLEHTACRPRQASAGLRYAPSYVLAPYLTPVLPTWLAMRASTVTATHVVRNASMTASMSKKDVIIPTFQKQEGWGIAADPFIEDRWCRGGRGLKARSAARVDGLDPPGMPERG